MFLRKQKAAHLINTGSIQPFGTDKAVPFAYKFQKPRISRFAAFTFSFNSLFLKFLPDLIGQLRRFKRDREFFGPRRQAFKGEFRIRDA